MTATGISTNAPTKRVSASQAVAAPLSGTVLSVHVGNHSTVKGGETVLVLESMKVHVPIAAPKAGLVEQLTLMQGQTVERGDTLFVLQGSADLSVDDEQAPAAQPLAQEGKVTDAFKENGQTAKAIERADELNSRALDAQRPDALSKRKAKGYRSARENLDDLLDGGHFVEYGQLAVAAQRKRMDVEGLRTNTAADGVITGIGQVNTDLFNQGDCYTALIVNDYSVLAGTQGFFHHQKLDRILAVARKRKLPIIMYTEGGGGRPGDTDVTTMTTGLHCQSFLSWAALNGVVPRIAVANGYNFAGNAALYGAADITIATQTSWVGMAGPAMIEGGGLGVYKPTEIGPIEVQASNGVVDIVADDEAQASDYAKRCLGLFQGRLESWQALPQESLRAQMPDNRRLTYAVREIINTVVDESSFIELKQGFGESIVIGFARVKGHAVGLMANDCTVLGGAIDVDAGDKATDFIQLCNDFSIPLISLCDTPGFMVGPQHEERGAVRRLAKLFTAGSQLDVPSVGIILRKCYGLGAQAMLGGSTLAPNHTAAWPTAEFGAMGLEGAVRLGFKRELEAADNEEQRQALFDTLLEQQYQQGQATKIAAVLEVDAVIDPADTRQTIVQALGLD